MEDWRFTAKAIVQYDKIDIDNNELQKYWTSISDIGKVYNNKIITYEDYKSVEKKYTDSVILISKHFNNSYFLLSNLFLYSDINDFKSTHNIEVLETFTNLKEETYDIKFLEDVIKLNLREHINCEIVLDPSSETIIRFGYDYYMYINSNINLDSIFDRIRKETGLYVW